MPIAIIRRTNFYGSPYLHRVSVSQYLWQIYTAPGHLNYH